VEGLRRGRRTYRERRLEGNVGRFKDVGSTVLFHSRS
jgi:hypothetical protein